MSQFESAPAAMSLPSPAICEVIKAPQEEEYVRSASNPFNPDGLIDSVPKLEPMPGTEDVSLKKPDVAAETHVEARDEATSPSGDIPTTQTEETTQPTPEQSNAQDRELIAFAQSDSPRAGDAFGALFHTQRHRIGSVLREMNIDPDTIEDILQITAMKAFQAFSTFDANHGDLFPWTVTIAKRTAIDLIRKRSAGSRPPESLYATPEDIDLDPAADTYAPEDVERQVIASVLVADALTAYRGRTRHPERAPWFCQVLIGELTVPECAQILGIPDGTVKSGVHNMKKAMLEILSDTQ